jgi:uncharacterized protein RhaS with RHS repeats
VYQATNSAGPTANYYYDGLGERVEKVVGSTATVFVYDAFGNLAEEYSPYNMWSKDASFWAGRWWRLKIRRRIRAARVS